MDNGFTGIDFEGAYNQEIQMFNTVESMFNGLSMDLSKFFINLRRNWASENASNFSIN